MKLMNLTLAALAMAGLAMFTGCGDTSEPTLGEAEIETDTYSADTDAQNDAADTVTAQTPADQQPQQQNNVQYGAPERDQTTQFEGEIENNNDDFLIEQPEVEGEIEADAEEDNLNM